MAIESAWFPNDIRTELNARAENDDVVAYDDSTELQYRVLLARPVYVLEQRCRTSNDTEEWTSVVSFAAVVPVPVRRCFARRVCKRSSSSRTPPLWDGTTSRRSAV